MRLAGLALVALAAGCVAPALSPAAHDGGALRFAPPVVLTTAGPGFEPSVKVAPDGTAYVAAAKTTRPNADARLADWLWYSKDGVSWSDLPSPASAHEAMIGLEGDLAVDGKGRLYYADTWLFDNSLSRWSPGPTWDWSRPLQGTVPLVDDRPFMAAHGDGRVYLLSNTATPGHRIVLSRSTDGGVTWLPGAAFADSVFCMIAASPADDQRAMVACANGEGANAPLVVHESRDGGATWTPTTIPGAFERGTGYLAPGAAFDADGRAFVAWADDRVDWSGVQDANWNGDAPGRVLVAERAGGTWRAQDVTPFPGRFGVLYACAGRGSVGMSFYATRDLAVTDATEWRAYALLSRDASSDAPSWSLAPLSPDPVSKGAYPPRDIQECAIGPDGAVHVAFQRDRDQPGGPGDGIRADILYARGS